jgi:hypothetical protein
MGGVVDRTRMDRQGPRDTSSGTSRQTCLLAVWICETTQTKNNLESINLIGVVPLRRDAKVMVGKTELELHRRSDMRSNSNGDTIIESIKPE